MDSRESHLDPDPGLADELLLGLERAVDAVIDHVTRPGAVDAVDDEALLESLRRVERIRNRMPVIDQALITQTAQRELPQRYCQGSTKRFLAGLLRLSPAEAGRRVTAAEALCEHLSPTGEPLPAARPALALAQHQGESSPEQTDIVLAALASVDHRGFAAEEITAAEELLAELAGRFAPPDLRRLARHTVEAIDPDGTVPHDQVTTDRRHLTLRQGRDGMWRGDFRLTPVAGAKLETVLRPLCADRTIRLDPARDDGTETSEGSGAGGTEDELTGAAVAAAGAASKAAGAVLADERNYPQRLHDALEEACDLLLRSEELPASGGTPATVIITLTDHQLARRTGAAQTADGATVSVRDLAHLAGEADVCTVVASPTGAPLTLGRTRRIATPTQTLALIARDGGCSFPGCDRAPRWCERHHMVPWYGGGCTDLDNLTLLCPYHHRHHLDRGWMVRLSPDRLPEWIPPSWIDPARRPMINHRVLALHARPSAGGSLHPGNGRVCRPRRTSVPSTLRPVSRFDEGWWRTLEPTVAQESVTAPSTTIPPEPPGELWPQGLEVGLEPALQDDWAAALEPLEPPRHLTELWRVEAGLDRATHLKPV